MTMRVAFVALFAMLLPAVACHAQSDPNEVAIAAKMAALAGDAAVRCGFVRVKKDFDTAWACARKADADKKPFWLALQLMGTDSDVWEGIARDVRGTRYTFFYTSNRSGQRQFEPDFDVHKRTKPFAFDPNKLFVVGCLPI